MNIPTIFELIERFEFLRGYTAVLIVLVTAVVIVLFWDWRLALFALIVQYLVVSLLFVDLLDPRLAVVKLLTGMFVCLILYWTARQVDYGHVPPDLAAAEIKAIGEEKQLKLGQWRGHIWRVPTSLAVRLGLVVVVLIFIGWLTRLPSFHLPGIPDALPHIDLAVLILVGLGLLAMAVSRDPLSAGMGLFTFLIGFELYYSALEQSVAMLAALTGLNLALAVAIAYLTQARRAAWYALIE
ncbi:MAG: hypothetical protein KDE48_09220 [Anaerolineales bacterium]|nr:hypothetical protein [Anaerolineales bacterium]